MNTNKSYVVGVVLSLALWNAGAAPVTFSGIDAGAGPASAHPNSNAAAASFDAAASPLGVETIVTLESAPLGAFTSLVIAPGVTLTAAGFGTNINNTPNSSAPTLYGFNTTTGGSRFIDVEGGTVTFTFATPVNSFGGYFTGVQSLFGAESVSFSDGTAMVIALPVPAANAGGVEFFGFTDPGKLITSITINASSDAIGLDDVRFTSVAASVPEPSSIGLLALGLTSLVVITRRRRRA